MSCGDGDPLPAVGDPDHRVAISQPGRVRAEETVVEGACDALNGRYELRGLIGRGGMAEVHRGFDRVLRRDVAVKMMHSALAETAERHRFTAETRLLASLNDPHLVTLLDAGVDETGPAARPWFVMELVRGPALARRLLDGPLDKPETARVGAGVAGALTHVHALDIVHRDVKPANILLTPSGTAKLADFGVARAMSADHTLTQTGHVIGTAAYLAPEQITGTPVTGASDVYALGLVLLEALTGCRAYTGDPQETAFARLHHSPTIPVSLGPRWTRLLAQMTAFNPADRPDAAELAERLTAVDGRFDPAFPVEATAAEAAPTGLWTTGAARLGMTDATPERLPRDRKRRWHSPRAPVMIKAAVSLVAVVLLAGVLAWLTHRPPGSPPTASAAGVKSAAKSIASKSRSDRSTQPATPSTRATNAPARVPVALPHHTIRHRSYAGHSRPRENHSGPGRRTRHAPHPPRRPDRPHKPHKPHKHPHGHGHRHHRPH